MTLHAAKRAEELARRGELNAAERAYKRILISSPRSFEALRGLGVLLNRQGRNAEAVERLAAALMVKPDDAIALAELGLATAELGNHREALGLYDRALALGGYQALALNYRGMSLLELGRATDALASFDAAIALSPDAIAAVRNNRGNALLELGRIDEALESYDLALAAEPDLADAWVNKAIALAEVGRIAEAIELVERAIALQPKTARYYWRLAGLKALAPGDAHVRAMLDLVADPSRAEAERVDLHFALGRVFAGAGDHDRAFSHFLDANALRRKTTAYDEDATLAAIEAIPAGFPPELLSAADGLGDPSEQPVFVLGMPRSGTTLVEQILASHPKAFGTGETALFARILRRFPPNAIDLDAAPADATELWRDHMQRIGADFLAALRERSPPEAERTVEKTLENWRLVGLIRLALPNARIIHVTRNPLDACVSCFSRQFVDLPYTYDLAELGRHYRAQAALMDYWRGCTPDHILLEIRYEEIVADLEGQARRLLAHCGLDWDPHCLEFHRTERRVRTASVTQVRQPIYDTSIGSWRAYERFLGPLIAELGPLVSASKS